MFVFRDALLDPDSGTGVRVEVAFTDATLDLTEDSEEFATSLTAVVEAAGVPFARLRQVHGDEVTHVVQPLTGDTDGAPHADGLVTTERGVGLMVRVADCVPVLLGDPSSGVVGAVHAGRLGMTLGVVPRAVDRMRALGARHVRAWVGPHVCGRCYEVPAEMRHEVATVVPEAASETSWGTPALDLGAGVSAQLAAADATVTRVDRCTLEDADLPSYRRDGAAAGRFAGLVWMA